MATEAEIRDAHHAVVASGESRDEAGLAKLHDGSRGTGCPLVFTVIASPLASRSISLSAVVFTDDQILFLVPAYNEITQYVPGKQVTFQVAEKAALRI